MTARRAMLKCKWCKWQTPLWPKNGWSRLADHVSRIHDRDDFNEFLVIYGTTEKGADAMFRAKERP